MSNDQATILEVQGMTCPSCIRHVNAALADLEGVHQVDVQLRAGLVVVTHDPGQAPSTQLVEALDRAGYPARPQQR